MAKNKVKKKVWKVNRLPLDPTLARQARCMVPAKYRTSLKDARIQIPHLFLFLFCHHCY